MKKKKEDRDSKRGRGGSAKKTAAAKGKAKSVKESDGASPVSVHVEPVSVELSVELGRWRSAAEAQPQLSPSRDSNPQPPDTR